MSRRREQLDQIGACCAIAALILMGLPIAVALFVMGG